MTEHVFFPGARRIAIVSDSHRDSIAMELLAAELQGVQGILHLGDSMPDAELLSRLTGLPVCGVRGNVDLPGGVPEILGRLGSREGPRFLACHGHRWGVKDGLYSLLRHAQEEGVELAFYGHTHIARDTTEEGVRLINPGALRDGRWCLLHLDGQRAETRSLRED